MSKSTKTVKVAGISGIPKGAASVIVAVRTSKAKAGTLALSTRGASRPARGIGFATAGQTSFAVVTPDASGRISLSALSGKASVRLQVLGWSAGTTTLVAPARPTGGKLSSTSKKKITIAGTSGIPKSAKAVAVTLNAPKGWSVKIWANSRGTGTPLVSAVSTGAAQQVWVPVPKDRAIAVQAKAPKTKSKKKTNAVATTMFGGYIDAASADQMLSITPKAGTHLLSAGDVLAEREGGIIDLAASSGGAQVGDHLFVRSAQSAPISAASSRARRSATGGRASRCRASTRCRSRSTSTTPTSPARSRTLSRWRARQPPGAWCRGLPRSGNARIHRHGLPRIRALELRWIRRPA
ncbi:hypothetical protein [Leucobacter soli]|uniref:hypothetical protein n=1 Tax=Leucobacter soli TaxID=2812850 RepID=UPI00361C98AE